jgi:hypothetical protein
MLWLTDLTFGEKLWNKGVDIAASILASTISALIIAGIATLTWRFKRKRDLKLEADKQLQHEEIALKLERERRRTDQRDRVKRLARERDEFAAAVAGAPIGRILDQGVRGYYEWMNNEGLTNLPGNQRILAALANLDVNLRFVDALNLPGFAKSLGEQVKLTELPSADLPD